jgi:hypothetical protein
MRQDYALVVSNQMLSPFHLFLNLLSTGSMENGLPTRYENVYAVWLQ